ncbi:hypothetical protein, partial [Sinorhizobium meliloti]|uniref:hypothetical protein n=1 Tax=Rhizobium meliloti TaxID=382 RepID=UPI001AECC75F
MAFHRSPFVASGNPVFMQLEETASLFHNADYLILPCSGGTFYFQVRHANKNKGFALEIFGCRSAICSSPFP